MAHDVVYGIPIRRQVVRAVGDAWATAAEILGHSMALTERKYGSVVHYRMACSCGWDSGGGRSRRFAINSGIGHAARIADRQRAEGVGHSDEFAKPRRVAKRVRSRAS